ncbi:hypothetical protein ACJIZ3_023164 [Penstemon smallii]|uniref:Thioredoxin domain-containing protein n=1 Tax=Penstemon smallii TaxID=265156 RepID=A0ABD3TQP9_9LAMI
MATPSPMFKKKASCRISCGMFFYPKVTFKQLVAKSDIPVLVAFYCDLHSVFVELLLRRVYAIAERYDGRLKKLAEYFGIEEVPTIMMFKNAMVFGDPFVGVVEDEDVIYKAIEELLAS